MRYAFFVLCVSASSRDMLNIWTHVFLYTNIKDGKNTVIFIFCFFYILIFVYSVYLYSYCIPIVRSVLLRPNFCTCCYFLIAFTNINQYEGLTRQDKSTINYIFRQIWTNIISTFEVLTIQNKSKTRARQKRTIARFWEERRMSSALNFTINHVVDA